MQLCTILSQTGITNLHMNRPGYVDVNQLQAETTLEAAAAKCGFTLDVKGSGKEVRIDCPFGCAGDHVGRKEIAINTQNPQKVFMCHDYTCKARGNLLTLMHGWLTGSKPTGGTLKGAEFKRVRDVLAGQTELPAKRALPSDASMDSPSPAKIKRNTPLIRSTDARVRELHNIDEKFITDVAAMNPAAAAYVREHPCLSSESMKTWRCGYLPHDGGGDKRGWSLRGSIVYPVLSEAGDVLAWVGRDVKFEQKDHEFSQLNAAERSDRELPAKHRFPKGFLRGLELFGQQRSRLSEPGGEEFIAEHGIIVVEGMNSTINLSNLGIPSVAIMSNRITEAQANKVTRWANQLSSSRVILMFDCDAPGTEGAKEALWLLTERGLHVRLAWSPQMHGSAFVGRQPESLTRDECDAIVRY